jgi:hypothetical protein
MAQKRLKVSAGIRGPTVFVACNQIAWRSWNLMN